MLSSRDGERLSSMTRQQPTKWQGAPPKKDETKNSNIVSEKSLMKVKKNLYF